MPHRIIKRLPVLLAIACAGLLAGCYSARPTAKASPEAKPSKKVATTAEWPAEKRTKAQAHYGAGVIHEMNNEPDSALEEFRLAALNDPENEELVLEVSRRFLQRKEFEKAQELLVLAVTRPEASGAIYAYLGLVYGQLGKNDLAIEAGRRAIKRSPAYLGGYQNLFTTLLQTKQDAEALKVLDTAASRPEVSAEFLVGLAELYTAYVFQLPASKEKVRSRAVATLNRAKEQNPESPMIRLRLADCYTTHGESAKAAELYLDLLKRLPDVQPVRERLHAKLATIYLRDDRNRTNAIEQLQAMVRDNPTHPQAYYYLGFLHYSEKKPAEAEDYFKKAILLNPQFAEAYYDLALAQLSQNKHTEALETLGKAREKFQESFVLEFYTGLAYGERKDYASALKHFTAAEIMAKATDQKLIDRDLLFQLGACHERLGDYARAEEYFEKCLKVAPDWPEALNYLGYMWAERGEKLDRARELLEKAVKAEPKNAAFLDSLAWVLYRQNQPEQALHYALQSIELIEKPDPVLLDHLGDIYAALRQNDKAREAWKRSLELEANEKIKKKLDELQP